jgi:hypothetical protein
MARSGGGHHSCSRERRFVILYSIYIERERTRDREKEREIERDREKKVGWSWLNVRATRRLYTLQCNIVKEYVVLR